MTLSPVSSGSPISSGADFTINGRFLTQKVTGVQRYALNVVAALDRLLSQQGATGRIVAPQGTADPGHAALPMTAGGALSGHLWEQITLPARSEGRLLNLCNTAPAVKTDQIVCIHDANIFTAPQSYGRGFRAVYGLLQPLLTRRAARITTVSHFSARQIARYLPIRASDIAVLPNGHEHALRWNAERAEKAPALLTGRLYVLAIGSQARHKNLALLADLAPQLDAAGIDVVIAGGGGDIFAAATLAAAPNLHLTGPVSDDDLAFLMDHALCLAFPSWTEGFGLPIVEAMARGCPVISSDRASMPDICGDAARLAAPDDPQAWLRHILELKGSNTLRTELTGRGREQVRRFSWTETAAGYLDLLRDPAHLPEAAPTVPPAGKVAVVIATRGRPEVVSATVRHLAANQTLKPERIVISCTDPTDAGDLAELPGVEVLTGPPGLPAQRNTALAALPPDTDMVAFFDDDFVADRDWLAVALRSFRDDPALVGFTGRVLADGIGGPGISFGDACRMAAAPPPPCDWSWIAPYSPYGCNMAFRFPAIGALRFDEKLVLYGWLEDRDFAAALARQSNGRLAKSADARGVHMGTKGGRVSGRRFGYSQIVNPLYMIRKGTMTPGQAMGQIFRNLSKNLVLSARPEPWVDRRGRLRGNLLGISDMMKGRIAPERATEL
ncbi:glycosyltransferase [Paenirhodobacter populi]|uniref:glycosyltransferase n=1 Tax=Paenirhodobacter populi TaxID=2306993 RepID=UPI0019D4E62F|nr:glycosyltransferase [Sinirhodobacter populi]